MNRLELVNQIKAKRSFLCVGLDTDLKKVPQHILNDEDPIFAFNKAIIDATPTTACRTSRTSHSTRRSA